MCHAYSIRLWDKEIALREAQRTIQEKDAALEESALQAARDHETIAVLQAQVRELSGR